MIYLDNAATSFPKPEGVYAALDHFARHTLANPGRAGHKMALAAEHGVSGTWVTADVTTWEPPHTYDLVVVFYLQLPADEMGLALRTAVRALAPGGTFLLVCHDLLNLSEGHGGPQDARVLTTAEGVLDDLAAAELTLDVELVTERAEQVDRVVATPEGDRSAIDTLVRVRRIDAAPASAAGTGASV